jgi:hypothetical protein
LSGTGRIVVVSSTWALGAVSAGAEAVTATGGAGSDDAATDLLPDAAGGVDRLRVVDGAEVAVGVRVGVFVVVGAVVCADGGGSSSVRCVTGGGGAPIAAGGNTADMAGSGCTAIAPAPATRTTALARATLCPTPATALPVLAAALPAALLAADVRNVRAAAHMPVSRTTTAPKVFLTQRSVGRCCS